MNEIKFEELGIKYNNPENVHYVILDTQLPIGARVEYIIGHDYSIERVEIADNQRWRTWLRLGWNAA